MSKLLGAIVVAALAGCTNGAMRDKTQMRPDESLPAGHDVTCEGDFDTAPRLLSGKAPVFPASTLSNLEFIEDRKIRRLPLDWTVNSRFDVLDGGTTANVRSNRTEPAFFATHTNAAISAWRFQPATRGGVPVPAACTYVLNFSIRS